MQLNIKRLTAYFIDIIIISVVAALISNISFINPKIKDYKKDYNEYVTIVKSYQENKISSKTYQKQIKNYTYYLNNDSLVTTFITLSLMLLYFGFYQWYKNGQTIGKKLMKIKIEDINNSKITIEKYMLRSIILYNIIIKLTDLVCLLFLSKNRYLLISNILYNIEMGITLVIMISIIFSKDKRGLHDLLCKTKVVTLDNEKVTSESTESKESDNKVKIAKVKEVKKSKTKKEKK